MRSIWVAFEGGEGSGKSTQAARLAAALDAVLTREPGGTAVGAQVRELLLDPSVASMDARAEALLMAADRAQHIAEVVRPALAAGRSVVSDRSAYSSLAYQGVGRGIGVDAVWELCDWATDGLWPDVVIAMDVAEEVSSARMKPTPDRLESAGADFHERVAEGFRILADRFADRWLVVDGAGSVDEVEGRVGSVLDAWVAARS
ncbi:MAG TPA: dTMP kinase [Acidimicrobiales bacterium]|nr:dTMP kinase [Acidimicrobiales bacterium]